MTEEEKNALKQEIINDLKNESTDITELESTTSLNGLTSLPAMQGSKMVLAPIGALAQPAIDAAATANTAARNASVAAEDAIAAKNAANTAATNANEAKDAANTAAEKANTATDDANTALLELKDYNKVAKVVKDGSSARFNGFVDFAEIKLISSTAKGGVIVYVRSEKKFAYAVGSPVQYCSNWSVEGLPPATMFMNDGFTEILKDKTYLCGNKTYIWDDAVSDLVVQGDGYVHRVLTEAEYDALEVKDDKTIYLVYEEE